jgi:hypothetical protein
VAKPTAFTPVLSDIGHSSQLLAAGSTGRRERFQIPRILPATYSQDIRYQHSRRLQ